jgi:hypothetical protein
VQIKYVGRKAVVRIPIMVGRHTPRKVPSWAGGSPSFSYDLGGALAKSRADLFSIPSTSEISVVEGAEAHM